VGRATFGLTIDRWMDRRNRTTRNTGAMLTLSCCENRHWQFSLSVQVSLLVRCIVANLSRVDKSPPQQIAACMHGLSAAQYAFRPSYVIRTLEIYICFRRSPHTVYMHVCGVCMRWVRATAKSNCSFDNSVENNIGSNKKSCSGGRHLRLGGKHIKSRK
jgi:hypothetical protein